MLWVLTRPKIKSETVYFMSKKIFLIAGEPSGDVLGAGLIRELKSQSRVPIEFIGVGGPLMEAEGLQSIVPMDELCVMGLWEVIWQLPRLLRLINGVVEEIEGAEPDAVVTIDLPDFNFEVARRIKKRALSSAKMIHYVAPSVWAWRPGRAKKIAALYDKVLCLLPFEPPYFKAHEMEADFVGHPLVEEAKNFNGQDFREKNGITPQDKVLGLFLGSREGELHKHANVLKEAAQIIREQDPDVKIVIPTLPDFEYLVLKAIEDWDFETIVVSLPSLKWNSFAACDVAVAVSGTVGLELAYIGVPHVIAYKTHPITAMAVKRMIKVKYAHLANILLDAPVVPEYLQGKCNSLNVAKGLLSLLRKPEDRAAQKQAFAKLGQRLRPEGGVSPSVVAAKSVIETLNAGPKAKDHSLSSTST